MAYATDTYTSAGEATYTVTFPYILQSHVKVFINGVEDTDFTWDNATTVRPTPTPTSGDIVKIERQSNPSARLTDHQDASTLTEAILDADAKQLFYLAQEAFDRSDEAIGLDTVGTNWDAASKRILNVTDPTGAQDAATKNYVDTQNPTLDAANTWTDSNTFTGGFTVSNTSPQLRFNETDADTDDKLWDAIAFGEAWRIRALTDAGVAGGSSVAMAVNRTNNVIDSVNFPATAVQVKGRALQGEVIASGSPTAVASVDFTSLPTEFDFFKLFIYELRPATDADDLWVRVSTDGGSTFISGAGSYNWAAAALDVGSTLEDSATSTAVVLNPLANGFSNAATAGGYLEVTILGLHDANARTTVICNGMYTSNTGAEKSVLSHGQRWIDQVNDAFQILFSTGNIAEMKYTLVGYRQS